MRAGQKFWANTFLLYKFKALRSVLAHFENGVLVGLAGTFPVLYICNVLHSYLCGIVSIMTTLQKFCVLPRPVFIFSQLKILHQNILGGREESGEWIVLRGSYISFFVFFLCSDSVEAI